MAGEQSWRVASLFSHGNPLQLQKEEQGVCVCTVGEYVCLDKYAGKSV